MNFGCVITLTLMVIILAEQSISKLIIIYFQVNFKGSQRLHFGWFVCKVVPGLERSDHCDQPVRELPLGGQVRVGGHK